MNEGTVADVIVIGAGIVGAACAQALARRGLDVLVLDAGLPNATAAGMGHLLVLDDNPAELALSQYSVQRWREHAPDLPEGCAYRNNGTLWIAANAEEMAVAETKYHNLRAHGIGCELLDGQALHEREPQLREGLEGSADGATAFSMPRPRRAGCWRPRASASAGHGSAKSTAIAYGSTTVTGWQPMRWSWPMAYRLTSCVRSCPSSRRRATC